MNTQAVTVWCMAKEGTKATEPIQISLELFDEPLQQRNDQITENVSMLTLSHLLSKTLPKFTLRLRRLRRLRMLRMLRRDPGRSGSSLWSPGTTSWTTGKSAGPGGCGNSTRCSAFPKCRFQLQVSQVLQTLARGRFSNSRPHKEASGSQAQNSQNSHSDFYRKKDERRCMMLSWCRLLYTAAHKSHCRSVAFSTDGRFCSGLFPWRFATLLEGQCYFGEVRLDAQMEASKSWTRSSSQLCI